jgi:hypothetical protein
MGLVKAYNFLSLEKRGSIGKDFSRRILRELEREIQREIQREILRKPTGNTRGDLAGYSLTCSGFRCRLPQLSSWSLTYNLECCLFLSILLGSKPKAWNTLYHHVGSSKLQCACCRWWSRGFICLFSSISRRD